MVLSVHRMYLLARIVEYQPCYYRQKWEEELSRDRQNQRAQEQRRNQGLCKRSRVLHDAEGEDAKNGQEKVLRIVDRPMVRSEGV